MKRNPPRRRFLETVVGAAAVAAGERASAQAAAPHLGSPTRGGGIRGIDHVAVPMQDTEAMLAFYRGLGLQMNETANAASVYIGDQMINFHRPTRWQDKAFTLRAPAARPPCGDFCFVWDGTPESLKATLDRVGARVEVGPVERAGGRRRSGSSTYVRDPDGNLLEFMIY